MRSPLTKTEDEQWFRNYIREYKIREEKKFHSLRSGDFQAGGL